MFERRTSGTEAWAVAAGVAAGAGVLASLVGAVSVALAAAL